MNKSQKNELLKEWEEAITKIAKEMGELLRSQHIFKETRNIVVSKGKKYSGSLFFNWIVDLYVARLTVGIRRIIDSHRPGDFKTLSLPNLLNNIVKNNGVLTRSIFCSGYPDYLQETGDPDDCFNKFADEDSEELNVEWLKNDINSLTNETKKIRYYIDKWVVHHDLKREQNQVPTFGDVDSALQFLDKLICKYHLLLAGSDLSGTCKPVLNKNWTNILKQIWL